MFQKLTELEATYKELTEKLADPATHSDADLFRETSKKLSDITPVVDLYRQYREVEAEHAQTVSHAEERRVQPVGPHHRSASAQPVQGGQVVAA